MGADETKTDLCKLLICSVNGMRCQVPNRIIQKGWKNSCKKRNKIGEVDDFSNYVIDQHEKGFWRGYVLYFSSNDVKMDQEAIDNGTDEEDEEGEEEEEDKKDEDDKKGPDTGDNDKGPLSSDEGIDGDLANKDAKEAALAGKKPALD